MEKPESKTMNEQTCEIRFKPNPNVLDRRGEIATSFSQHMELSEWQIGENRVDIFSKDQLARVFVAFRNAGVVIRKAPLPDYFPNQSAKFARHLFALKILQDPVIIDRIGVRSRFAIPSQLSFKDLLLQFERKVVNISKEASLIFDANLTDIGAPINFETKIGKINSHSGPMEKEQLSKFFRLEDKEELPEVALYLDFDYWAKPTDPQSAKDIANLIKSYASENWQRYQKLTSLVLGS